MYFREWRLHRGLTGEQLAERLETGKGSISKLENGYTLFNQSNLEAWADALSCDPIDFFRPPPKDGEPDEKAVTALLKKASPEDRQKALAVVSAMLKAG
jgi:transcriptional regulator with XRE-family HTH domain